MLGLQCHRPRHLVRLTNCKRSQVVKPHAWSVRPIQLKSIDRSSLWVGRFHADGKGSGFSGKCGSGSFRTPGVGALARKRLCLAGA